MSTGYNPDAEHVGGWIAGEAIADAVNFANDFRQLWNESVIDDLPASRPQDPQHCVLANAFNFDCEVDKDGNTWEIKFEYYSLETLERAKAQGESLAKILDTDFGNYVVDHDEDYCEGHIWVSLPEHIGRIAEVFDAFQLDDQYYLNGKPEKPIE